MASLIQSLFRYLMSLRTSSTLKAMRFRDSGGRLVEERLSTNELTKVWHNTMHGAALIDSFTRRMASSKVWLKWWLLLLTWLKYLECLTQQRPSSRGQVSIHLKIITLICSASLTTKRLIFTTEWTERMSSIWVRPIWRSHCTRENGSTQQFRSFGSRLSHKNLSFLVMIKQNGGSLGDGSSTWSESKLIWKSQLSMR